MLHIAFVVREGFQINGLCAQSAFELANLVAGEEFYKIHLSSFRGGMVPSSLGFGLETQPIQNLRSIDTALFPNVLDPTDTLTKEEIQIVRQISKRARRTAGLCTGAFILAQAGLLDGKRATTHWAFAQVMQKRYPAVRVESDRIFIHEDNLWTSAGMTAGLDLALAMVEKDLGAEVARSVAHNMVMHHRRAGGQSQHSELLQLAAKSDRIQNALNHAKQHLKSDLSVEKLAELVHLSPRQFSRAFRSETGRSPAKAIEHLRVEAARIMLEGSVHPIDVVARETGFIDRRRMRESFMRVYGQPPQTIRRNSRAA